MTQHSHETTVFPLDDAVIDIIQQADTQIKETARDLNNFVNGALQYFIRTHKLQGQWRLSANRREIELAAVPEAQPVANGNG